MKRLNAVFLMSVASGQRACDLARQAGVDLDVVFVNDVDALERAFSIRHDLLLSFGTGVIVPARILAMPGLLALNVHAASPQYPGRDPHHFAVYDGATQYGATMHYMTQSVDAGPIVDTELFDVPAGVTPSGLLDLANEAGWKLIKRFFAAYKNAQGAPGPLDGLSWGQRKSTRKMFLEMCRIDPSMPKEEITRRYKATAMPGYRNLYVDLHGYRFRIEEPAG
jgi:methionyl-tRNA formyltransferase